MREQDATESIDSERAQIAHEIHDALMPLVVGAKAALESHLDSETSQHADRQKLQRAFEWLSDALQVGRQLLVSTHPPELNQMSWDVAVRGAAASILGPNVSLQWQLSDGVDSYSEAVAAAAYRITVEAIRNAARHGQATQIKITADKDAVTIQDNGVGFDPAEISRDRFGIRSMKGRAKLVGGELKLDTQIGGPTTVMFCITSV